MRCARVNTIRNDAAEASRKMEAFALLYFIPTAQFI